MKNQLVINAAGGNTTAIEIINQPLKREEYETQGLKLLDKFQQFSAEQAGFLVTSGDHLEMSGGEFCGNATRAAALILSELRGKEAISFSVSGFPGLVQGSVRKIADNKFNVKCLFPNFNLVVSSQVVDGIKMSVVDLGGIIHVILNENFPKNYKQVHQKIVSCLGLEKRDAVGVIWAQQKLEGVNINPVVWVRSIDTFFYESSCGSGSIAVAKAWGAEKISQPTGQAIFVKFYSHNDCELTSEMEVINGID
jgi:diaminopimelate epimerase